MVIIIESPGKKKSIEKYTGAIVLPTFGHIKDLPLNKIGVDLSTFEGDFLPKDDRAKKNIRFIKNQCKNQDVYIATDGDREGEAIAAMVYQEIKDVCKSSYRVIFGEITKKVVNEEIKKAPLFKEFQWNNYYSFLGRRIGDRIVGYLLSNIAHKESNWNKDDDRMSVGRVQTISVKAIVEREKEIRNFKPEAYWVISGLGEKNEKKFRILHSDNNFKNKENAVSVFNKINNSTIGIVSKKEVKDSPSKPKPPYITSSIQAHSSSVLSLSGKQTMAILQKLFEGFGDGGLITYHRTDSSFMSSEYSLSIGEYLKIKYPNEYSGIRIYKSKNSQAEAHECIRPTDEPGKYSEKAEMIYKKMEEYKTGLGKKSKRLYEMICERTLSSQLDDAIYEKTNLEILIENENFKASGRVIKKLGYTIIKLEEEEDDEEQSDITLPSLEIGDNINISDIKNEEKYTNPPLRYTEPSLIKKLEKDGIGRPSTYASIIGILFNKKYAKKDKKYIVPLQKSFVLVDYMEEKYPFLVNYKFTANLESDLDKVASGEKKWQDVLFELYEKMGKPTPMSRGVSKKMLEFALSISEKQNVEFNMEQKEDVIYVKKFIEDNLDTSPSEKQLNFARKLEEETGQKLTDKASSSKIEIAKWIERAMKKQVRNLSPKQKEIVIKNAPDKIINLLDSSSINDKKNVQDWLNNFFKNLKK